MLIQLAKDNIDSVKRSVVLKGGLHDGAIYNLQYVKGLFLGGPFGAGSNSAPGSPVHRRSNKCTQYPLPAVLRASDLESEPPVPCEVGDLLKMAYYDIEVIFR